MIRFWPVFVPLMLYLLWMWMRRARAARDGEEAPAWTSGPMLWVFMVTVLCFVIGFVYWGLNSAPPEDGRYIPPQMKDGEIVPGHTEP